MRPRSEERIRKRGFFTFVPAYIYFRQWRLYGVLTCRIFPLSKGKKFSPEIYDTHCAFHVNFPFTGINILVSHWPRYSRLDFLRRKEKERKKREREESIFIYFVNIEMRNSHVLLSKNIRYSFYSRYYQAVLWSASLFVIFYSQSLRVHNALLYV